MSLSNVVAVTKPLVDAVRGADLPNYRTVTIILRQATKEAHAITITSVGQKPDGIFEVRTVVQYEFGGTWYPKEISSHLSLSAALKKADGLNRKHYKVTASRSIAGLLADSVVPATEDIDF